MINPGRHNGAGELHSDMIASTPIATDISNHCSQGALTGSLGLFVQALLALVAFSALIVKRYCEPIKTRREWKTWWLDTSKQAVGAGVIHVINVILSEHLFVGDPCTWYVITFMLDSTVGLVIICICLKLSLCFILRNRWHHLVFGTYSLPSPCRSWLYQCSIYVVIIIIEKITITILTLFEFWKKVGGWILSRTTDADLELIVVMFIIPLIVNAIIFWIVDNFLKLHHPMQSSSAKKQLHEPRSDASRTGRNSRDGDARVRTPEQGLQTGSNFVGRMPPGIGDELVPLFRANLDEEDEPVVSFSATSDASNPSFVVVSRIQN